MYIQDIQNGFRHAVIGTLLLVVQVAFTFAVLAHGGIPIQNRMGSNNFDQIRSLERQESPEIPATRYAPDFGIVDLLGMKIIEGRDFTKADVRWVKAVSEEGGPSVIVTQTFADSLFPEGSAVGKQAVISRLFKRPLYEILAKTSKISQ
jgi:hypothetical protein